MGRVNSFGRKKDRKPPTPDAASEDTIPDAIHPPTTPATDELPACTVDFAITLKKVHGRLGLKLTDANLVAGVEAGSGAAVSGMMLGDSLMEVDGVKVSSYAELLPVLQSIPPEGLTVVRSAWCYSFELHAKVQAEATGVSSQFEVFNREMQV